MRACVLSGYLVKAVGLDVNSVDHAQRTPVYMAAANGKVATAASIMLHLDLVDTRQSDTYL